MPMAVGLGHVNGLLYNPIVSFKTSFKKCIAKYGPGLLPIRNGASGRPALATALSIWTSNDGMSADCQVEEITARTPVFLVNKCSKPRQSTTIVIDMPFFNLSQLNCMNRRRFLAAGTAAVSCRIFSSQPSRLISSISKHTLWSNRDGKRRTWFHPRACMIPDPAGNPIVLMNLQEIAGSDYFGQVHWSISQDLGKTWTQPKPIESLGRDPVPGRADGLKAAVCDVTPQYHPQTGKVIALGHVVFYKGEHFARSEQLARYPVYVTRSPDGTWSKRKKLEWDDPRGAFIYTNNCGQRVVQPNGDIQMSFTFGPRSKARMVSGVRASFDGQSLKLREVGPPLQNSTGRGLLEPSVIRFAGKYWITIRAEDDRGYVSVSDNGLNWEPQRAWCWDDGQPLQMSTTQQHWLSHSDGLFLVYTRKDPSNANVIRWRSPLWVAQVDLKKRCLIKSTEQVVLPLVGDGIKDPDSVALMGNFNVTNISPEESWVTVGEWMPRNGFLGDVLLARIRWSKPNRLPLW